MYNKVTLIVNPISGRLKNNNKVFEYITRFVSEIGSSVSIKKTSKRGDAIDFGRQAVEENADLVVAVGGDGTINEVGTGLVNSQVPMAIIPMGSGNGLTRSLRIPQNVKKACALILNGNVTDMDAGKANERYFFLIAGVGFDAVVGKKYDKSPRRGPLPYFYHSVVEYFRYQPESIRVELNDQTYQLSPFLLAVANGQQFGNNAIIAPDAKLNDGLLDVCIIHRFRFLDVFSALPKLFSGKLQEFSGAEFHKAKTVVIERQAPGYINIDGEPVFEQAEVKISILSGCLKIITPSNCPGLMT